MNERQDPLEAELKALWPQPISPDLRRRIATSLEDRVPAAPRSLRRLALAVSLAAASFAVVVWWRIGGQDVVPPPEFVGPQPDVIREPDVITEADIAEPTLLAYQCALARSPEELETLLDRHFMKTPLLHRELACVGAFTRSDTALDTLLGDD